MKKNKKQEYTHEAVFQTNDNQLKIKLYKLFNKTTQPEKGFFTKRIDKDHKYIKSHKTATHIYKTFLLIYGEKGSSVAAHYHTYSQRFIIISGDLRETESQKIYQKNMVFDMPPHKNHGLFCDSDVLFLISMK